MAICTKTGLIINDDEIEEYDVEKTILANPDLKVSVGKAKKPDGTEITYSKKTK